MDNLDYSFNHFFASFNFVHRLLPDCRISLPLIFFITNEETLLNQNII